mgnify:FL=1
MNQIVPLTRQILDDFCQDPPPVTVKGIAVQTEGRTIGLAGYFPDGERWILFARLSDELRADKRTIIKGIRHLVQMMRGRKLPIHAIKDDCIEGAETLLRHAGFTQIRGNLYGRQP